ncbi:ORF1 [Sugarcane bacilliform MO virus]|uniref:ORF1 n=1 Tax=Sugarcane bacilliform MO virus TaxID=362399 RepID=Q86996_9VIRU|nr:ORF1 [Sugarcane bacilliform MO virus]AAA47452.1 ORF1 [Sugarcane bacilliform MO virus]
MKSEAEWETQFTAWKNSHIFENANQELILGTKISNSDLNHNLRTTCYRVDLGYKVLLTSQQKAFEHRKELFSEGRKHLADQSRKLQLVADKAEQSLIIQKEQRARLKKVEDGLSTLSREIHDLRVEYLKRRPLSKEDVAELVLTISEQPKLIEKQTELLLEQVKKLVETTRREVETVHHMVKRIS